MGETTLSESQRWIDDHGDCLYRFALARVRDADAAVWYKKHFSRPCKAVVAKAGPRRSADG